MDGLRTRSLLLVAAVAALASGCRVPAPPSVPARRASFERLQGGFRGDRVELKRRTYLVFSGGPDFRVSLDSSTGAMEFLGSDDGFSAGLGTGITADGFILTAAHCLRSGTNVHVVGWLSGTLACASARVVFQRRSDGHAGLAVLQVDAAVVCFPELAPPPESGAPVFAVVCHRQGTAMELDLAGGTLRGIRTEAADAPARIIESNLPLTFGDSGGPLVSADGRLIGINTGITYGLRRHWSDSVVLDQDLLQTVLRSE